jgi:hypothetical protein
MPTEMVPTAAIWRARLVRLPAVRKRGSSAVKMAQMTANPMTTGSAPSSPPLIRRRNSSQ